MEKLSVRNNVKVIKQGKLKQKEEKNFAMTLPQSVIMTSDPKALLWKNSCCFSTLLLTILIENHNPAQRDNNFRRLHCTLHCLDTNSFVSILWKEFLTFNNKESLFLLCKLFPVSFLMVISKSLTTWFNIKMGSVHLIMSTKESIFVFAWSAFS